VRKLVVSEFITLDGVFEAPAWTFQYGSEEQEQYKLRELRESDALLLGRVTYEAFAQAWPTMKDPAGFADQMNSMPKYVVSTTLKTGSWNNTTIIPDNVAKEVQRLKEQQGKNILVGGSAKLIETLMRHNLVDEYRLMVFPVIQGKGRRLFGEGAGEMTLTPVDVTKFKSGVTVLVYRAVR
jgi:dihydrofolate reductase